MLVVTLRTWPDGDATTNPTLAAVAFDHVAELADGRGTYVGLTSGDGHAPPGGARIDHNRNDGPLALLVRVLAAATPDGAAQLDATHRAALQDALDRAMAAAPTVQPPADPPGHKPDPDRDVMRRELEAIAEYAQRQIDHAEEVGWASQERTWFHVLSRTERALHDQPGPSEI